MWSLKSIFLCGFLAALAQEFESDEDTTTEANGNDTLLEGEEKLSEYILTVLEYFKTSDPVGLPEDILPDPYPVPDSEQSIGLMDRLIMRNTMMYGTSKLRILYIHADIKSLEFEAAMSIEELQARGQYKLSSWWFGVYQPFVMNATGLKGTATGTLSVEQDGKLRVQNVLIDLNCTKLKANFENIGIVGGWIQDFMNSRSLLFDSIKPTIINDAYTNIQTQVNAKLEEVAGGVQFPNTITPLDMVLLDLGFKIRNMSLDPYHIKDYTSTGVFTIFMTNTWIYGISSLYRVGNTTMKMENNTFTVDFEIGTKKLEGKTQWDISAVNGLIARAGTASFSVEYLGVHVIVKQSLDTRKVPEIENLELDIGNIQIRCDGAGTLDYVIEFVVNIFPNLIRYQILDAVEIPLRTIIQKKLNELDVDEILRTQILPEVDVIQESGINLSSLKVPINTNQCEGDDFFNF